MNGCNSDPLFLINDTVSLNYPNVFTPNGDGVNDLFESLYGGPYESFYSEIKSGSKVLFQADDPYEVWDGTYNGQDVKEGVYDFNLIADFGGDHWEFERTITLIRDLNDRIINNCGSCVSIYSEGDLCM
ncbi:MAG: gliding motility-associated-like protein [Arenicella sp.]|jgi:gliding motility-associated-like protein